MTEFQDGVLRLVSRVPKGRVTTYREIARALDKPRAYRAVANVLARNPRPVKIPCHRVVRSDGRVGGYRFGEKRKARLLIEESIKIEDEKIDLREYIFKFG